MRNGDEWERRVFIRVFQGGGESEKRRYTRWFNWDKECGNWDLRVKGT
jgi:hypothetical protein